MFDNSPKHFVYNLSLILILLSGFVLAYMNSSNKIFQTEVVIAATFLYVLWGILHHFLNHDLNVKIVIEYILVGSIGLAIIIFLLKGGLRL